MTVAEATPDLEQVDRNDRAFLGHPKGLGFLGFTEGCERFSYYSMQTLLVLYMVNYLLLPGRMEKVIGLQWLQAHVYHGISGQPLASAIFGTYTSLVYGTPILGGIIADKWLGRNRTLILGGVLMAIGHVLMAIEPAFVFALFALLLGVGCFKGNIATQVGALYGPNDLRRAMAFQIFYIFINVSVILAPLISGTLGQKVGWALRLRLRRRGDGARPLHLSRRPPLPAGRRTSVAKGGPGEEAPSDPQRLAVGRLPGHSHSRPCRVASHQPADLQCLSRLGRPAVRPQAAQQYEQLADHRRCDRQFHHARCRRSLLEMVGFAPPRAGRDQQDDHRQRLHRRRRALPVHGGIDPASWRQDQPRLAD